MPTIINLAQIEVLKKYGGQDIIKESFSIFIKESKILMKTAKDALNKQDYKQIATASHSLKGSARTLGIEKLGDAAHKLEQLCKDNQTNQVNSAFKTLEICFDEFMQNYQAILGI
jgi:HPt (histidine-containing phosphotransfer) domain-containing protein